MADDRVPFAVTAAITAELPEAVSQVRRLAYSRLVARARQFQGR
ncbi:MAG TPA: hypothetical protein VF940_33940 [Streptosporangiaceae bacterium]